MFPKKNLGVLDRTIRILRGVGILTLTAVGPKSLIGLIGVVPLVTGIIGWCPAYCPLGIRTCKVS